MLFIPLELSTHFGLPWGSAVLADPLGQGELTMLSWEKPILPRRTPSAGLVGSSQR